MKKNSILSLAHIANIIFLNCCFFANRVNKNKSCFQFYRLVSRIFPIVIVVVITSCKPTFYIKSSHGAAIKIKMPVSSAICDTFALTNSFSNKFVSTTGALHFKNNYTLSDSITLGFNVFEIKEEEYKDENQLKIREGEVIGVTRWVSDNLTHKESTINGYKFLLIFYTLNKSKTDYFVHFESTQTTPLLYSGVIRFPSDYSLKKIERKTVVFLSDITKAK